MIATTAEIGPSAYSEKWYAYRTFDPDRVERPVVIGGSQAAAALGVDRYTSPLELYLRLRGELPPVEVTTAMRFGTRVERVVLEWYAEDEQAELAYDQPMYFSRNFPWMAVTPDALRVDQPRGVDAKASNGRMRDKTGGDEHKFGEPGTDQVPLYILAQAQQYCVVLGVDRVDFPVLFDGRSRETYYVERNPDLVAALIAAETEMAERVVSGDPPEPTWEHPDTGKLLRALYGYTPEKHVDLSEEAARLWAQAEEWKAEAKRLEKEARSNQNKVLAELGDAEKGVLPGTGKAVKRIAVGPCEYTVRRDGYEYLRAV